jgi:hypothetical protein
LGICLSPLRVPAAMEPSMLRGAGDHRLAAVAASSRSMEIVSSGHHGPMQRGIQLGALASVAKRTDG